MLQTLPIIARIVRQYRKIGGLGDESNQRSFAPAAELVRTPCRSRCRYITDPACRMEKALKETFIGSWIASCSCAVDHNLQH